MICSPGCGLRDRARRRCGPRLQYVLPAFVRRAGDAAVGPICNRSDMRSDLDQRRFIVQPHRFDFDAGTASDGRQVLIGALHPYVVCVLFRADGSLLELA